ncbi:MAG TPA: hypothetical protein VLU91_03235 [Nitrososphaerales archaeon]|nr:hypothetical protein [Nitrososphaerales archaeon]
MNYMESNRQLILSTRFNPRRFCLNCGKPLDETKGLCSNCVMVANLFIG